ncbi:MAG: hypothetical protein EAZ92_06575 [Candidatus Kapaibacterium sp.]|nr:MAG: hypothetical protein EAZ92_06575 [Candidatus Kapabacteria bacterium]
MMKFAATPVQCLRSVLAYSSHCLLLVLCCAVLLVFGHESVQAQCSTGFPVITEIYSNDGRAENGCAIAGVGSNVVIIGCNLDNTRVFVVPNGRPEEAVEQTNILSRTNTSISFAMGASPSNSVVEVRKFINGSFVPPASSRCFVGIPNEGAGPIIYQVTPLVTSPTGTTVLYIIGAGFRQGLEVRIGGQQFQSEYRARSIDNLSNPPRNLDTIVVRVVGCASGLVEVRNVRTNLGSTHPQPVRCIGGTPEPTITNFSPNRGGRGAIVTVEGTNLQHVTQARIGRKDATIVEQSATRIVLLVGEGGTGRIELTSPGGTAEASTFTFIPRPIINEVAPIMVGPGTPVILYGEYLQGAQVLFGNPQSGGTLSPVSVDVSDDGTRLTAQIGTIGTITTAFGRTPAFSVPVQVSTLGGGPVIARDRLQFVADEFRIPRISLRPANARGGARVQADTLFLRERVVTYFAPQTADGGEILLERRGWNSGLSILTRLTYRSSTGTVLTELRGLDPVFDATLPEELRERINLPIPPLANGQSISLLSKFPPRGSEMTNGLLPDLEPRARTLGSNDQTNLLNVRENVIPMPIFNNDFISYDSASMSFVARWSDQNYAINPHNKPQTPSLQGRRTLTVELLEPLVRGTYEVDPAGRTATVVLDDPDPTTSVRVINPIPNKTIAPGSPDDIELERIANVVSPLTGDYQPSAVFLDETYSILQYSATTSDPAVLLNVRIDTSRSGSQPRLRYQLAPSARSGMGATITVTARNNRGGTASHTFSVNVLQGAPVITRIEPSAAAPGAEVRIIGSDLANLRSVVFPSRAGGSSITAEVVSTSADVVVVRVPANAASGPLTLATRVGTTQTMTFTVIRTPQIQGFSPDTVVAGASIAIRGLNFEGVSAVTFGGVSALEFTVVSDSLIRARVRNGASGVIQLTNPRESIMSSRIVIIIPPPIISSVSPQSGGTGTDVLVRGDNFTGVGFTRPDSVFINNRAVPFTVQTSPSGSPSGLAFSVPDFGLEQLNNLPIRIVTRGGSTTASVGFTFTPCPRVENIIPQTGGPLDSISVFGNNFGGVIGVTIGGVPVRGFRIVSVGEVRVAVGSVNTGRVVLRSAVCSDSSTTAFTYLAPARPLLVSLGSLGNSIFGKIFPNETTTGSLSLMNLGAQPMSLTLTLTQDTEATFSFATPMPSQTQAITLQRNEVASIAVRFSPKSSGYKTVRLTASGQGLSAAQDTVLTAQAGTWQIFPVAFDTVRVGRRTVRTARVVNRNTQASRLDAVRIMLDAVQGSQASNSAGLSVLGTLPRWVGMGDTVAAIIQSAPRANGAFSASVQVETLGIDSARGRVFGTAREVRATDIVVEPTLVALPDSQDIGQNTALRLEARITSGVTAFPRTVQMLGAVRWNRNVLLPILNPNASSVPQTQGFTRIVRNSDARNASLRAEIIPQVLPAEWNGASAPVLISLPLGVYLGETPTSALELEEVRFTDTQNSTRQIFVEEPKNGVFTARTGGRRLTTRTSSSLDVVSPSPTGSAVNVRYTIPTETAIVLTLVDAYGRRAKTIVEGWRGAGVYEHTFDATELASGQYFVMLHTERDHASKILNLVR